MNLNNLNELAAQVHIANAKWWQDFETGKPLQLNRGQLLMLVVTELAEAVEGIRKNLMDDKLPHRTMEEVEMADAFIRLLDYAGGFKISVSHIEHLGELPDDKAEAVMMLTLIVSAIYVDVIQGDAIGECNSICGAITAIRKYCEKFNLDLAGAYAEKMAFNATRHDHSVEARKLANGKKF